MSLPVSNEYSDRPMETIRRLSVIIAMLLPIVAYGGRPVTSAFSIEAGASRISDTYLSPLPYHGWHTGLDYERFQAMRHNPERCIMRLNINATLDRTLNPAGNAAMWQAGVDASWAMMWRWTLRWTPGLRVAAGGMADLDAGALYLSRNGNNPVSARAAVTLGLTAMATWSTRIGRLPVTVRYQPSMPIIGACFSPAYGELYYEMALGNRSGLVHVAWPGNRFVIKNLLTADLRFGATALRIGYSGKFISGKINDIVTRYASHSVTVGVSGEWISLDPRGRNRSSTPDISAYY